MARCPTLRDYMYFIDAVREYHTKNDFTDLEGAIEQAISRCIRENVLKEFLIEHRTEVTHVMTMDYTFERRLEFQREEAMEEGERRGREEGERRGRVEARKELICKKLLKRKSLEQIAEELEESPEAIRPVYVQIQKELRLDRNCKQE